MQLQTIKIFLIIAIIILFTFGVAILINSEKKNMPSKFPTQIHLTGATVSINYLADPYISRGEFRLANQSAHSINASIKSVSLQVGNKIEKLSDYSAFDIGLGKEIDVDNLYVKAKSGLVFSVGFPRIEYTSSFKDSIGLELIVNVEGVELQAVSPIKLTKRIPRNR